MLVMCSEWHVCSYPSYYAGNLVIMKLVLLASQLWMLETSSIPVIMYHSDIAVSFNKYTLCKSLWIKASAKCPKCECVCFVFLDAVPTWAAGEGGPRPSLLGKTVTSLVSWCTSWAMWSGSGTNTPDLTGTNMSASSGTTFSQVAIG